MTNIADIPGKIHISHRAIASIAYESALSSYGVVGLAAKNFAENLSRVLIKDPNLGVEITFIKNEIVLDVFIVVEVFLRPWSNVFVVLSMSSHLKKCKRKLEKLDAVLRYAT